jgi:uncharacterized membrane protein
MMTYLILLRNSFLAVHFLCAAIWVGGMFYTVTVLRPALTVLDAGPRLQLHMLTLKKFFFWVWHAMPLMLLTGWAMIWSAWGGFAMLPWSINAMQGIAIIMAGIFVYTFFGPWQRLRRAIRPGPELIARIRLLVTVNLALGAITIVVGSLGHVW